MLDGGCSAMCGYDLIYDKKSQAVTLLGRVFIADHIMRSVVEFFYLFVGSTNTIIGNVYCAFAVICCHTNIDHAALHVMIDAVLIY